MGGRVEKVCPSIGRIEIKPQLEFALDDRPKFIKPRMLISELINLRPGVMKLLRSVHLGQMLFQPRNFTV